MLNLNTFVTESFRYARWGGCMGECRGKLIPLSSPVLSVAIWSGVREGRGEVDQTDLYGLSRRAGWIVRSVDFENAESGQ